VLLAVALFAVIAIVVKLTLGVFAGDGGPGSKAAAPARAEPPARENARPERRQVPGTGAPTEPPDVPPPHETTEPILPPEKGPLPVLPAEPARDAGE